MQKAEKEAMNERQKAENKGISTLLLWFTQIQKDAQYFQPMSGARIEKPMPDLAVSPEDTLAILLQNYMILKRIKKLHNITLLVSLFLSLLTHISWFSSF